VFDGLITVAAPPGSESFPLVVGALALLGAITLLAVAVRSSRQRGSVAGAVALALALGQAASAHAARPTQSAPLAFGERVPEARGGMLVVPFAPTPCRVSGERPRPLRAADALRGPAIPGRRGGVRGPFPASFRALAEQGPARPGDVYF